MVLPHAEKQKKIQTKINADPELKKNSKRKKKKRERWHRGKEWGK